MKAKTVSLAIYGMLLLGLPAKPLADQPLLPDDFSESCALAAAPRALQTFYWLTCAPEPRAVWASSERPRDPELVTTPRGMEQLPPARMVPLSDTRRTVILARNQQGDARFRGASARVVQRYSSLSRTGTARGGAAQLMDFAN